MPGLDGIALCIAFSGDSVLKTVPIILSSSLELPTHHMSPLYDAFLRKPAPTAALLTAVSSLMQPVSLTGEAHG
ncbi:CheY-like chemotaxis protein [Paraburkholderia sp. WC7.3g]